MKISNILLGGLFKDPENGTISSNRVSSIALIGFGIEEIIAGDNKMGLYLVAFGVVLQCATLIIEKKFADK